MTRLENNAKLIALLHPDLRLDATIIAQELELKLKGRSKFRVISTLRSAAEQTKLYNLGRTVKNPDGVTKSKPLGQVVTNAKAWQSNHNFGTSLDFALDVDTDGNGTFETTKWDISKDYDNDGVADWLEVINTFKAHGWGSGADWKTFRDYPHVEKSFGFSVKDLAAKVKAGKVDKLGYVILK